MPMTRIVLAIATLMLGSASEKLTAADIRELLAGENLRESLGINSENVQLASALVRIDRAAAINASEIDSLRWTALRSANETIHGDGGYTVSRSIDDVDRRSSSGPTRNAVSSAFYERPQGFNNPPTIYGRLVVAVAPSEDEAEAKKLLDATLDAWLKEIRERERKLIGKMQTEQKEKQKAAEEAQDNLSQLQAKQLALSGQSELPYTVVMESIGNLHREKQSTQLELVGLEARAAAIQEQVKLAGERAKTTGADISVIRELQEVLGVREQQLARIHALHESGTITEHEVLSAREQLLQAKVELAKARSAATGGGERLDKFNTDLVQVAIDTTAAKAKLQFIVKELEELLQQSRQQREIEQELENLGSEIEKARENLASARQATGSTQTWLDNFKPTTIEVIKPEDLPIP